jgi:hypothetical protein
MRNCVLAIMLALGLIGAQSAVSKADQATTQPVFQVVIQKDAAGNTEAIIENAHLRARYAMWNNRKDLIRSFLFKDTNQELIGEFDSRHTGSDLTMYRLTKASVAYDGPDRKVLQMEFGENSKRIVQVTLDPDSTVLRMDYVKFTQSGHGVDIWERDSSYVAYGAEAWRDQRAAAATRPSEPIVAATKPATGPATTQAAGLSRVLTDLLYPRLEYSYYRRDWKLGSKALSYKGWIILGAVDDKTGQGFCRMLPATNLSWMKFTRRGGIEWTMDKKPFHSYLFPVQGGAAEILATGKSIADKDPLPELDSTTKKDGQLENP